MNNLAAFMKRYPLWVCFALAFALSWGGLLAVVGFAAFIGRADIPEAKMPLVYLAVLVGPSVAGVLLTAVIQGKSGLRALRTRLFKWRVGIRWYLMALFTAPLAMATTLLLIGWQNPEILPGITTADNIVAFVLTGIAGGLAAGIFEELGWTGFAVPQLRQRYGILISGLIMGILWGAWHYPLFSGNGRSSGTLSPTLYLLVLLFSFLPAYRVLMVWVYDRTSSLLIAMLMHMSLTASTLIFQPLDTGLNAIIYDLGLTAVLWTIVAAVALANRRQLARYPYQKRTV